MKKYGLSLLTLFIFITALGQPAESKAPTVSDFRSALSKRFPWISGTKKEFKSLLDYAIKKVKGQPISDKTRREAWQAAIKTGISLAVAIAVVTSFVATISWLGKDIREEIRGWKQGLKDIKKDAKELRKDLEKIRDDSTIP